MSKPNTPARAIDFTPPEIEFLGEQCGPVENELQDQLRKLFVKRVAIQRAYLARVSYGEPVDFAVCLCIRSTEPCDDDLEEQVGQIFREMFKKDECLDTMFINEKHENELSKVCQPFYVAS